MRNMRNLPTRQAGYTLPEIIVGVVVAGLVAAAVLAAGKDLIGGTEVDGEQSKLDVIQKNVKDLYSQRANFSNLDQSAAIDGGVFPSSMVSDGSAFNKWNGNVTVAAANDTAGNTDRGFEVVWEGVEEDSCSKMATGTSADEVSIDGTSVTDSTGQVDPADAAQQCAGGAADITFLYNK
ncbi:type 4 pilus major pilin [Marinobacter halodurans]|nr:type 4 pilus major pilin [Marinobacter halodurans]